MKSNGKNHVDRRLAFLEKVYQEDRLRWRRFEARARKTDERLDRQEAAIVKLLRLVQQDRKKSDERWKKSDERWKKNDERWKKNDERWKKNDARIDAMLKILYRRMEG